MTFPNRLEHFGKWLPAGLAVVSLVAMGLIVSVSLSGSEPFELGADATHTLAEDKAIAAWVSFDRPSYHRGDIVGYRFELLWRDSEVAPDLEAFENSVSFYPFDEKSARFVEDGMAGGLRRFVAEFALQPVDVEIPGSYQLDTATVFYTRRGDDDVTVHAVRATPPPTYLGAYFPEDIRTIEAQPTKPGFDEARALRSLGMALLGVALLAAAASLVWQRVRRRPYPALEPVEQLWRDFRELRRRESRDRRYLVRCEHVYTDALEAQHAISATEFWSGSADDSVEAGTDLAAARAAFAAAYRHEEPDTEAIERVEDLVDGFLGSAVDTVRMEREMRAGIAERLRGQPRFVAATGVVAVAGLVALGLAAAPSAWLAADVRDYNAAVGVLDEDGEAQAALDAFLALAERAEDARVEAAALYNAGTLLGDPRVAGLSPNQHYNFREAIFSSEITLSRLMHSLEIDAELELVALMTDLTRRYVQAEDVLKAAVRLDPRDGDARRNLELFTKIRKAIGRTISRLVTQGEQGDGGQQMLSQTVIDLRLLMESEIPEEMSREDEGKDDRNYFILERF